jgi:aspartate/methionine/tyrosine aminotransferase
MSRTAARFAPFGTTIFTEMTLLAQKHGAVNLAQGFPDFDGPAFIKRAAAEAMNLSGDGQNQYARMFGVPALNAAIAADWQARTGIVTSADTDVTVTSGCTEAICAALMGLVNPGERVLLFEPFYDSYRASVAMAGAEPLVVTLHAPDAGHGAFWFDESRLREAFGLKPRCVLLNTPHNPTGKVFSRAELELIARLCVEHDVIALVDQVYEHLTYDPELPHLNLAAFPGMAGRTLTLSSLGKTFSLTGWKIGWSIGPADLSRAVRAAHQFITFATATPLQVGAAAAVGSERGREAIAELVAMLDDNRRFLSRVLTGVGFRVFQPAGAYFVMVDWTQARPGGGAELGELFETDAAFCRHLTEHAGVCAIPPSVFYQNVQHGRSLARFAFCKRRETLEQAAARLEAWAGRAG